MFTTKNTNEKHHFKFDILETANFNQFYQLELV